MCSRTVQEIMVPMTGQTVGSRWLLIAESRSADPQATRPKVRRYELVRLQATEPAAGGEGGGQRP